MQYGYYTIGGNETTNKTRVSETICETGYFCEQGMKFRCPPGRYGSAKGLTTEFCSGYCPAGHMCGWNTTTPLECKPGYYAARILWKHRHQLQEQDEVLPDWMAEREGEQNL